MSENDSGSKRCETLTPEEKCIWLQKYKQGNFLDLFHKHVPKDKLDQEVHGALLRTLVLRYEEAAAEKILDVYLTRDGEAANSILGHDVSVGYPEPGVMRSACGGNVFAWIDTVIDPEEFRRSEENQKG